MLKVNKKYQDHVIDFLVYLLLNFSIVVFEQVNDR